MDYITTESGADVYNEATRREGVDYIITQVMLMYVRIVHGKARETRAESSLPGRVLFV